HCPERATVSSVMTHRTPRPKLAPKNDLAALQLSASESGHNRGCACAAGVRDRCRLRNRFNPADDGALFGRWFRFAGDCGGAPLLGALARLEGAFGEHHD